MSDRTVTLSDPLPEVDRLVVVADSTEPSSGEVAYVVLVAEPDAPEGRPRCRVHVLASDVDVNSLVRRGCGPAEHARTAEGCNGVVCRRGAVGEDSGDDFSVSGAVVLRRPVLLGPVGVAVLAHTVIVVQLVKAAVGQDNGWPSVQK